MNLDVIERLASELKVSSKNIQNVLELLDLDNTVAFIARYRKEMTNNLDEEDIRYIKKEYDYSINLIKRKEEVLNLIDKQAKLTDDIVRSVNEANTLSELEDIYRPYRQKRKTRASEAIALGLKPFSEYLLSLPFKGDIKLEAQKYLNDSLKDVDEVIEKTKDIIAEVVSDDPKVRSKIKDSINRYAKIHTSLKKDAQDEKLLYKQYYDYEERLNYIKAHRLMAINRASKAKIINVSFVYDKEYLINNIYLRYTRHKNSISNDIILSAIEDGLKRLAFPSVENEIYNERLEIAKEQSIDVFADNLERLLTISPLKTNVVMGFDPAFRTGCKLAIVDGSGKLLHIDKIFPHNGSKAFLEAQDRFAKLVNDFKVDVVAIGNGTASRESEKFISDTIKDKKLNIQYAIVSEAGASIYSASDLAREEFPNLQVEERSAVSIARRILDPLSELIKIDPKSIGVGQYQHDLKEKELSNRLDFVVDKVVNRVGVDLNTCSKELLLHISGMNKTKANAIIKYRDEKGSFNNRSELNKVKGLGAKTIEQASGFLRIIDGDEVLDSTKIHPESYDKVKQLLTKIGSDKIGSKELIEKLEMLDLSKTAKELNIDHFTLEDIIESLKEPLRDYREKYDGPVLRSDILDIKDLKVGDKLQGVVRNVVDFGAFIDIGLHDDGLVHISKMSKNRVDHPKDLLKVGDILEVYVLNIKEKEQKVELCLDESFL